MRSYKHSLSYSFFFFLFNLILYFFLLFFYLKYFLYDTASIEEVYNVICGPRREVASSLKIFFKLYNKYSVLIKYKIKLYYIIDRLMFLIDI